MSRRAATLTVTSALVLVLAMVGAQMPVPYVALMPGPTRNTLGSAPNGEALIKISGRQTYPDKGNLNFTTVTYRGGPDNRIGLLTALEGWLDGDVAIVPEETIFPDDESAEQVEQENTRQMRSSQASAEAAALRQLGIAVVPQVSVESVQKGMPAHGKLRAGDLITAVDGTPVKRVPEVIKAMSDLKIGDPVKLTYQRGGRQGQVTITTAASPDGSRAIVGITLADDFTFPFKIDITVGDIGGPSAGLMFSLAIVDKLTKGSLTGGKFIAGTGTITPEGKVGPIGGIQQKMIGARRAGATVFLTPTDNCADASKARPDGLRLVRADTLKQTVTALQALQSGSGAVPSCSDA